MSSNLSWHSVHLSVAVGAGVPEAGLSPVAGASEPGGVLPVDPPGPTSLDVTVVELTCRLPEDLLPLDDPEEHKFFNIIK